MNFKSAIFIEDARNWSDLVAVFENSIFYLKHIYKSIFSSHKIDSNLKKGPIKNLKHPPSKIFIQN